MSEVTSQDILSRASALKKNKESDYSSSNIKESDYFLFGDISYIQMLHMKMLRIRSVSQQEKVNYESLTDSLLDMINYAAMYAAWIENSPHE